MHTQTANVSELPAWLSSRFHVAAGLGLYLLTLAGEVVLGASVRWFLIYLAVAILGVVLPLGPAVDQLALLAALLPLVWSLLGLLFPSSGFIWSRRIGARRPSVEEAGIIDDACGLFRAGDTNLSEVPTVYVLDDPFPAAAARGRSIVLSRGLLETDAVAPVLAHELGHAFSLDGRLTEALGRLELWGDSPGQLNPRDALVRRAMSEEHPGILSGFIRPILRLARGGCAARLFAPLWSAYWRNREYAADAYAASLGQGEDLARHLVEAELPFDLPRPRFPLDLSEHPPVAHRIERLATTEHSRV